MEEIKKERAYIKPAIVLSYGKDLAKLISDAYLSRTAEEKLESVKKLMDSSLKIEAKVKFIGDIMIRPKKQRLAISREITDYLLKDDGNNNNQQPDSK